ncbi:zinc finger protein ZOP1 [Triticum urartu]|uniref:Matrin-type domain-containing protein n=1 Tax=Triticum urartu TaxID=4572 RepID=A0A8R7V3C5_TRIUA|nr:zinc finger protein ZOP1 [Triticum urartu]
MTEYWVSQGNKWCDLCKIFISNNPFSIRTHELGKRHKDNVTQRLSTMQKDGAAKEKEQQQAAKALQLIEAKAKKSYQKDLENNQRNTDGDSSAAPGEGWVFDSTSGYYYDKATGLYYDSNSGFYYSDGLGKWVTQEEAYKWAETSKTNVAQSSTSQPKTPSGGGPVAGIKGGPAPGVVVKKPLNPMRAVKGAPSALAANKRKREDTKKPKVVSKEEEAALRAREAARKRVEDREKPLMGLYKTY